MMQNILFVLHNDFKSNSAQHVHNFANQLIDLGLDCVVAVPEHKETISHLPPHRYRAITYPEARSAGQLFANRKGPDVVHAWTPREIVRLFCDELRARYHYKLIIHLEDNEEYLLEKFTGKPLSQLLHDEIDPFPPGLSHPRRYRSFLASADGATVIIDPLHEFVPGKLPWITLWPGVDRSLFFPRPPNRELARSIGVPLNSRVLCYTGNVHPANAAEVRSLYLAVAMMNREGHPTVLIRAGRDFCSYLGEDDRWAQKYAIDLGYISPPQIPDFTSLADVLIQPGRPDRFNNYRFPSKLPEFLAMGRPVILPDSNIGHFMESGTHALVLPAVDALGIIGAVDAIARDPALERRLCDGAVQFAETHLDWQKNAVKLRQFYEAVSTRGVAQ